MQAFDVTKNGLLYIFDEKAPQLYTIDLEKRRILSVKEFSREGPDAIGMLISNLKITSDSTFYLASFQNGDFTTTGKRLTDYRRRLESFTLPDDVEPFDLSLGGRLDSKGGQLYATVLNMETQDRKLCRVDLAEQKAFVYGIPQWSDFPEYRVEIREEGGGQMASESLIVQIFESGLLLSTSYESGVYRYDEMSDSLVYKGINHKAVASKKKLINKRRVFSQEEFAVEAMKLESQITFSKFLWNEKTQQFFRFGYNALHREYDSENKKYQIYLFIYDEDLDLISEHELGEWSSRPTNLFMYAGSVYSYVNINDELAFSVLTINN